MIRDRHHARIAMAMGRGDLVHPQTRASIGRQSKAVRAWLLFCAGVPMHLVGEDAVREGVREVKKAMKRKARKR